MTPDLYIRFEWMDCEEGKLQKILQSLSHVSGFVLPISMVLKIGTAQLKEILEPVVGQNQKIFCGVIPGGRDFFPVANILSWEAGISSGLINPRGIYLKHLDHLDADTNKRFVIDTEIEDLDEPLYSGNKQAELLKWAGFASLYGFNGIVLPWPVIKDSLRAWTGGRNKYPNCKKFVSVVLDDTDFAEVKSVWNAVCEPGSWVDGLIIRWQDNPYVDPRIQIREIERLITDRNS